MIKFSLNVFVSTYHGSQSLVENLPVFASISSFMIIGTLVGIVKTNENVNGSVVGKYQL